MIALIWEGIIVVGAGRLGRMMNSVRFTKVMNAACTAAPDWQSHCWSGSPEQHAARAGGEVLERDTDTAYLACARIARSVTRAVEAGKLARADADASADRIVRRRPNRSENAPEGFDILTATDRGSR
ncbi:hypothetical protein [Nocardia sp. NPDC059239]|uniref:hypothetical protein n=1 Tax=Nocardia sp. NPDC059239 TaxID=3346785 RepID=UPI0036738A33